MRIKKFTGATLKDATTLMKEELGAEAIILSTRKVHKGGVMNFFGREEFEVTAAIDEQAVNTKPGSAFAAELARVHASQPVQPARNDTFAGLQKVSERFEHRAKEKLSAKPESSLHTAAHYHELRAEMADLTSALHEVATHLKYKKMPVLPEPLRHAYMTLLEQDVDEKIAAELVQRVYRTGGEDVLSDPTKVEVCLLNEIASFFKPVPQGVSHGKPRTIALVGPTGVGKTTTIAKLAAISKLVHKQDVGLISADTYRIAAIEQLRTFAVIADIAMDVVYKASEMRTALAKFKDKDVVFIDTVGRSPRVRKEIAELSKFVSAANPHEVHQVISASTSSRSLNDIMENFRIIAPNRIIISKMDEAPGFGQVLNIAHISGLPIAYFTTGQSVPDDISVANNVQLARMVYSGELNA